MSATKINLLLGDIIEIVAPSNDTIHKEIFLITYIDKTQLIIKNEKQTQILGLENNNFNDKTIEKIHIMRRHKELGFAKQNNLIRGQWINIHFNDDVPVIITGEILSLDEDMIEVKTYPNNKMIYIDFEYKGIKQDFNIEKIVLRETPQDVVKNQDNDRQNDIIHMDSMKVPELENAEIKNENKDEQLNDNEKQNNENINEHQMNQSQKENTIHNNDNIHTTQNGDNKNNLSYLNETSPYIQAETFNNTDHVITDEILIEELNNTTMGRDLGRILQTVQVEENELRYGIQMQINDLTSDMVSKLPIEKRNKIAFDKIENMIKRFAVLRNNFSNFDIHYTPIDMNNNALDDNIYKKVILENKDIPLWFYFSGPFVKKVYNNIGVDGTENIDLMDEVNNYKEYNELYLKSRDPVHLKEINKILTTKSQLDDDNELDEIQIENKLLQIITNNRKYLTTQSINDKISNYSYNEIQTLIPGEIFKYKDFVLLNNKIFKYELLNAHSQLLLFQSLHTPKLKYLTNEFHNKIQSSRFKSTKSYDSIQHCERKSNLQTIDELFETYLPNKNEGIELFQKDLLNLQEASIHNFIGYLNAICLSTKHINYENYSQIKDIVYEYRRNVFKTKNSRKTIEARFTKYMIEPSKENDFSLFSQLLKNNSNLEIRDLLQKMLIDSYFQNSFENNIKERNLSTSELLDLMIQQDNTLYLQNLLSFNNINLKNDSFESMLVNYKEYINQSDNELNDGSSGEKCNIEIVIAKKYNDEEKLHNDNVQTIYFDKNYDSTFYPVLEIYKSEQEKMTPSQFQIFLASKLAEVNELNDDESAYMVETLLNGKKKVIDGQYALLETLDESQELVHLKLYKRVNDKWIYDENATQQHKDDFSLALNNNICSSELTCDVNLDPTNIKSDCLTNESKQQKIQQIVIKNMMNEFKHIYVKTENELKEILKTLSKNISKYEQNRLREFFKYSSKYDSIAQFYQADENIVISPYIELMNHIIVNSNLRERYDQILLFCNKFTRMPDTHNDENEYMLYCSNTNTPLIPLFFKKLAIAYKTNIETYKVTLQQILAHQCVVDGDKLIDEHTGYIISEHEFNTDEGYDDFGSKINTKSVLEEDDSEEYDESSDLVSNENNESSEILLDEQSELSEIERNNIEQRFESMVILETTKDEEPEFMYSSIVNSILVEYESILNLRFNNKPKIISYIFQHFERNKDKDGDEILGITVTTLCFIVLELQIQFHNLHITNIEGNCKPFLKGFPIFHESDSKTIHFILCLAKQLKLNKTLNEIEMRTLIDELQQELQKIVTTTMRMQVNEFLEHYKTTLSNKQIQNTMNFLPILKRVKLPAYKTIHKSTDKSNKILNNEDYIFYSSKLHELSYYIQESIQEVTSQQNPILRGRTIYTENFCCLENDSHKNPYLYFVSKSNALQTYNTHANEIQNYITSHNKYKKSNLYYDNNNTRISTLSINYHFADDVLKNALQTLEVEFTSDEVKVYIQNIHQKQIQDMPLLLANSSSNQFESLLNEKMAENNTSNEERDLKLKLESDVNKFIGKYYKLVADHNFNKDLDSKEQLLIQKDIFDFKLYLLEQINLMKTNITNNVIVSQRQNKNVHLHSRNPSKEKFDIFTSELLNKKTKLSRFQCSNILKCFHYFNRILISYFHDSLINENYRPHQYSVPKHWNFHDEHIHDLMEAHEKNNKYMKNMYNKKTLEPLIVSFGMYYKKISWFVEQNQLQIPGDNMINIFVQIYLFYVLHNELLILLEETGIPEMKHDGKEFLNSLLQLCSLRLEHVYIDKTYVEKKIVQSKEMEKNRITNELFELSDEERETYLMLKKHKLGRTGRGLSKSIFKYVGEEYVSNRDLFVEAEERENSDISNMNEDYEMV